MWRVTLKEVGAHKLRFALTGIAVILGVAWIAGTLVLTATIQQSFDDLFGNIYRGTDAVVRSHSNLKSDFGDLRPRVPAGLLNDVRTVPGVAAAEGTVSVPYAQVVGKDGKAIGGNGPPTFGIDWDPNPRLNQFRLTSGSRAPQNDDEIALDRQTASKGKLHVGDRVTILTEKAPKQYTLVGVARFGTADTVLGASITIFTEPEAQRLANAPGQYDTIAVVASPGVTQKEVKANLLRDLPRQYEAVTGKEVTKENQDQIAKNIGFISTGLLVFGFIAVIVGAFVIYNTFKITVAQRLRQLALLRAIGASRRQVLSSVIGESIVVGVVASAVGVVAGIGVAIGLKAAFNAFGFTLPAAGVTVRATAVIAGMLTGIIVTVTSAAAPAVRASRIPPVAAMRDVALEKPINTLVRIIVGGLITLIGILVMLQGLFGDAGILFVGIGALAVLIGVIVLSALFARALAHFVGAPLRKIKGITGELAEENAARNPRRTALTAAAVMISVALVGFITIFASSANASISRAIDQQLKTDYIITSGGGFGPGSGMSPELAKSIARLPEIQAVTPIRFAPMKVGGDTAFVVAADPQASAQLFDFGNKAGSFSSVGLDGVAVSQQKANDKHWKVGDLVPVTFQKTGTVPLRIDYIYKERGIAGNYLTSLQTFEKNVTDQLDFQIFAKLKPNVSAAQGAKAIEPLLKPYPTAKLKDNAEYKADQKKQVNQILAIVYVMLLFAIIIALIGILITLLLSVYERTREIGLLRAVGASRRQIRSTVRWEAVIMALLGTLLGIVIAFFFAWAVVKALSDQGFSEFAASPSSIIGIVIVAGLLSVLSALWPARRAARLDVLRAVASE